MSPVKNYGDGDIANISILNCITKRKIYYICATIFAENTKQKMQKD